MIDSFNPPRFAVCRVADFDDFQKEISKLGSFVFRGQESAAWKLSSSLEREYNKYPRRQMIEGVENYAIEYFRKRAYRYPDSVPNRENIADLLTAMQHYGSPTRLLDFTRSPYVALFFAVAAPSERKEAFAVWAINFALLEPLSKELTQKLFGTADIPEQLDNTLKDLTCFKDPGIIVVEPENISRRMSAQQGVLLAQTNIANSFETNLRTVLKIAEDAEEMTFDELSRINRNIINGIGIIKFEFDEKLIPAIRSRLLQMNITSETLFPDIHGLARNAVEHLFWR